MEIPLKQIGNYLEYAGYFIALRSGLCDVAGRSHCRQVVIFRDRMLNFSHEMEISDLHVDKVSSDAVYHLYSEGKIEESVKGIMDCLMNE